MVMSFPSQRRHTRTTAARRLDCHSPCTPLAAFSHAHYTRCCCAFVISASSAHVEPP